MGNLARKIIDAVQNTMLDSLLSRLVGLLWIGSIWQSQMQSDGMEVMATILIATGVIFALAWMLGALANRRPSPRKGPLQRLHQPPANGFEAWSELPAGGLRPPKLVRAAIMMLGTRKSRFSGWVRLMSFCAFLLAIGLIWALPNRPPSFWAGIHPWLSDTSVHDRLWAACAGLVVFLTIQSWATEQRARLEPTPIPMPPVSDWVSFAWVAISVFALCLAATTLLNLPFWIALALTIVLSLTALAPPWRNEFLDAIFGKRDQSPITPDQ